MKAKRNLSLELFWQGLANPEPDDEKDWERERLLRMLKRAVEGELTQCQQVCVRKRFLEQKQIVEIAQELHVNPSTVTRHIQRACGRLSRVIGYSFPRLADTHVFKKHS